MEKVRGLMGRMLAKSWSSLVPLCPQVSLADEQMGEKEWKRDRP